VTVRKFDFKVGAITFYCIDRDGVVDFFLDEALRDRCAEELERMEAGEP